MRVGYAFGVWDMLHVGHVRFLARAADACDRLTVGVCSDECVEVQKGRRPIVDEIERAEIVNGLKGVFETRLFHDINQTDLLREVGPSVFFPGADYGGEPDQQRTLAACKRFGVSVQYLPRTEGVSSTQRRLDAACS